MNLNNLLLKRTPFDSEVLLRNASLHTTSISTFEEHSAHGKISYRIFVGFARYMGTFGSQYLWYKINDYCINNQNSGGRLMLA